MDRRGGFLLVALLGALVTLAACGRPSSPEVASLPTVTPLPSVAARPVAHRSSTPLPARPTASPTPTPSASPTPTASPAPSPTPSPTSKPSPSPVPVWTPADGEALPLSLGWEFGANGHVAAGAVRPGNAQGVTTDNTPAFFLGTLNRTVYALNHSGTLLWKAGVPGPVYALALPDPDHLAVAGDQGITLLNLDGRRVWHTAVGTRITALRPGFDGDLLAGGWDKQVTRLGMDGAIRWQASVGSAVSGLALIPGRDLVLSGTMGGQVRAIRADGTEAWRLETGSPVTGLEATEHAGIDVLAGLQNGHLLALGVDPDEARVRWEQALGEGGLVWCVVNVTGDSKAEIAAGSGGSDPMLTLISAEGEMLWRVALPSPVNALVALELGGDGERPEILAGLASGEIVAFDADGRRLARVHAGLSVWSLLKVSGPEGERLLALADVVAWQVTPQQGRAGGPWLPPPPLASNSPVPQENGVDEAVLVFLGDVVPGRSMERQLTRYGPAYPWTGLAPLLRPADLAVANLESVLTTQGQPLEKLYVIRAHPNWGQMLVEGGIDLVTVANNHVLDYGQAGLDQMLRTLDSLGVAAMGAGQTADEARRPALFSLRGVRVAVLGYAAARWNGSADVPATHNIAWAEPALVQAAVHEAREQADAVIVVVHAGTEYAAEPSADLIAVAHAAIDAGADLVVGHHPHVTQTVEQYRDGLIVYSLGNALFDIPRPAAMRGHLLRVHLARDGLRRAELWPFWIEDAIRPRLLADGNGQPVVQVVYP